MTRVRVIDERTTQLYEHVCREPRNQQLIKAVDEPAEPYPTPVGDDVCVVLVPGLLYQDFPESGADGAALKAIAATLGIPFLTIPLDGTEGIGTATATIAEWLQFHCPPKAIVLISLSKGSAEVMHTLNHAVFRHAFNRVVAWISVSGLPLGTPSVELIMGNPIRWLFLHAYCYFKGWKLGSIREVLRHQPVPAQPLPFHMILIQVIAFPLHEHLQDRPSRRLHRQLAHIGPSDGYALLEELASLPGYVYPVWGADHYLRGMAEQPARLARVLAFVMRLRRL